MPRLDDSPDYAFAQAHFAPQKLWELFDGDRDALNIAHECVDRHAAADPARVAVRVAHADGARRSPDLPRTRRLRRPASRIGCAARASRPATGWRSCWSLRSPFYAALFGAMKRGRGRGAAVHPVRRRTACGCALDDCTPRLLLTNAGEGGGARRPAAACGWSSPTSVPGGAARAIPTRFAADTRADDMAMFQYTSGTTRELPAAVRHTHRAHRGGDDRRAVRHRHPARATGSSARPRPPGATGSGTARWRRWRSA